MQDIAEQQRILQRRIRFLLPTPVVIYIMVGMLLGVADAVAMKSNEVRGAFILLGILDALLVWNIVARRRLRNKLDRLMSGRCVGCGRDVGGVVERCPDCVKRLSVRCSECGYDLRATPQRCPECGAVAANEDKFAG